MSAAVGGAGTGAAAGGAAVVAAAACVTSTAVAAAASPAEPAGVAALPVACRAAPLNLIEWVTGTELTPGLEALRGNAGVADRLALEVITKRGESVVRGDERAYHALFEWLEAVRSTGALPASAPVKERTLAGLFQPMRDVRTRIVTTCARPGDPRRFGAADIAGGPRVRIMQLVALLGVDAAFIERMAADCSAALTAAQPLSSRLEAAYDAFDFTPARVAQRLHLLRMDGVGSISGPTDEEREYAALFKPVRKYRQELREHISGKGAAAAALHSDASVTRAVTMHLAVHEQSALMVSAACGVLATIGARASDATPAMRAAAFSLVAACMAVHESDDSTVAYACAAMTALGRGLAATTDAWAPTEGIAVTMKALHRRSGSASVVSALLFCLCRWTPQKGVPATILAAGAIPPCLAALARHSSDLEVAQSACGLLYGLAEATGAVAQIVEARGIPALVGALSAHGGDRNFAQAACEALRRIVIQAPEFAVAVLAGGAIRPVLAALAAHIRDDGVAEPACVILGDIVEKVYAFGSEEAAGAAIATIAASRGIQTLVAALAAHPREELMTVQACKLLGTMVNDADSQRVFVKAGGIPTTVSILKAAGTQSRSPASAALLLSRLAEASADYRRAIHAAGGIRALVGAMSAVLAKPQDNTADYVCCVAETLRHMLDEPEYAEEIVAVGAVPLFVSLITARHEGKAISSELAAANVCFLLRKLAACGHEAEIEATGGAPLLAAALESIAATC